MIREDKRVVDGLVQNEWEDRQRDHEVVEERTTLKLPLWRQTANDCMDHHNHRSHRILPSIECVLLQNQINYQRRSRVLRHYPYARPLRVQRFVGLFWLPPLISRQFPEDENEIGAVLFDMASSLMLTLERI